METSKWRAGIKDIDMYIPGKSIEDVKENYNLKEVIRLASNENPHGPSPKVLQAIKQEATKINYYPDSTARELRELLASFHEISPDQIVTANGAESILTLLANAYINEGDEVIYCTPTFPAYHSSTLLMGGVPIEVPLNNKLEFDLDAILGEITSKTKLIYICNPNNPTGTIISQEKLSAFLNNIPNHVYVIIDEAYMEYVTEKKKYEAIELFKKSYPIIIVRTFSKFYGLAGLRIGYAIADEKILQPVLRIREPFSTNRLAIKAAITALKDIEHEELHLKIISDGKKYLMENLKRFNYESSYSFTNFLFVNLKNDSAETLFNRLLHFGIIIRPCDAWDMPNYARISIGTKAQNEYLISTLNKIKNK